MAIWEELTKRGRKTAYTKVLTVLSRLYTRGFINKREKVINNARQHVYKSAIPHEIKAEIIREHLNLIIKVFGKDAIKIIKGLMENVDDKIKNILIRHVAIRRSFGGEATTVRPDEQFDNNELRLVAELALEYRQRVRDWLHKLSPGEYPPERLSVKVRG